MGETKGEEGGVEEIKEGGEEEGDQVLAAMQATADPLPLGAGDWQGAPQSEGVSEVGRRHMAAVVVLLTVI